MKRTLITVMGLAKLFLKSSGDVKQRIKMPLGGQKYREQQKPTWLHNHSYLYITLGLYLEFTRKLSRGHDY